MTEPDLKLVILVDEIVRDVATYVPDPKLNDSWTSYAQQVMSGQKFRGDCDDWAMTSLDILHRWYNVPKTRLYRALVSSTGADIDHMIGIVELPNGERWSIGDTFGPPKLVLGDRVGQHVIRQTSRMDERRGGLPLWRFWGKPQVRRTTNTAAMLMKISPDGVGFIKSYEKFISRVYDDFQPSKVLKPGDRVQGTLTIGYGHTGRDVFIGMPNWTEAQATRVLMQDLTSYEAGVRRLVRVPLTQNQYDALVSFCFNCGEANLASSTLLKKINARAPTSEIQVQFRRWNRSKGKVLGGLVRRRDAEAAMWAGNVLVTNAEPTLPERDITPSPLVEETKTAGKSITLWLTGALTAAPLVIEAARELRNMGIETNIVWVGQATGALMIAASGLLFAKRMYEIVVAARR